MLTFLNSDGSTIDEPLTNDYTGTTITVNMKLKNTGTSTLNGIYFYLEPPTSTQSVENLISYKSETEMLSYILAQGEAGYGISIDVEGLGTYVPFTNEAGSSVANGIPMILNGGSLDPEEEVTISIQYVIDSVLTAEDIGVQLIAGYTA